MIAISLSVLVERAPLGLPALMSTLTSTDDLLIGTPSVSREVVDAPRSDHALLEATRTGDEAAFGELVGRYRNQITNYIYRMTGDYDGAVDLAQETFVRIFRAMERYQTDYAFSTYIYRIATNLAISELRKRKRRKLVSLTGLFQSREESSELREFDPVDARPLQDTALVDAERRAAVARAISTLPEKYRAPLVLRDVEARSYDEIASILETNVGTVKSRISRARSFLRDKLKAYL
ncbi:MAG: sigma-70 family RNA polymerase sigma factor [Pyrinomonadaceae bacterium]